LILKCGRGTVKRLRADVTQTRRARSGPETATPRGAWPPSPVAAGGFPGPLRGPAPRFFLRVTSLVLFSRTLTSRWSGGPGRAHQGRARTGSRPRAEGWAGLAARPRRPPTPADTGINPSSPPFPKKTRDRHRLVGRGTRRPLSGRSLNPLDCSPIMTRPSPPARARPRFGPRSSGRTKRLCVLRDLRDGL